MGNIYCPELASNEICHQNCLNVGSDTFSMCSQSSVNTGTHMHTLSHTHTHAWIYVFDINQRPMRISDSILLRALNKQLKAELGVRISCVSVWVCVWVRVWINGHVCVCCCFVCLSFRFSRCSWNCLKFALFEVFALCRTYHFIFMTLTIVKINNSNNNNNCPKWPYK